MQDDAMILDERLQRLTVFINTIAQRTNQRCIGGDVHCGLLMWRQFFPDIPVDLHIGIDHDLVQALQVVVLKYFMKTKYQVGLGTTPFGGIDGAFFECR